MEALRTSEAEARKQMLQKLTDTPQWPTFQAVKVAEDAITWRLKNVLGDYTNGGHGVKKHSIKRKRVELKKISYQEMKSFKSKKEMNFGRGGAWDDLGGVYRTDTFGSTYIPTVQKYSGPIPWPPSIVSIEVSSVEVCVPVSVVISWEPPINQAVPVAFYSVEHRTDDGQWQCWGPIRDVTSYLVPSLIVGKTYYFRVYAYSIMSVGSASPEVIYWVPGSDTSSATAYYPTLSYLYMQPYMYDAATAFVPPSEMPYNVAPSGIST